MFFASKVFYSDCFIPLPAVSSPILGGSAREGNVIMIPQDKMSLIFLSVLMFRNMLTFIAFRPSYYWVSFENFRLNPTQRIKVLSWLSIINLLVPFEILYMQPF